MPTSLLSSPNPSARRHPRQNVAPASPSYFGLSVDGSNPTVSSSGARHVKGSKSPSSVSIRSAAASPPQSLPFHSTPDYDAFLHATEQKAFNLHQAAADPKISTPAEQPRDSRPLLERRSSRPAEPSTPKRPTPSLLRQRADAIAYPDPCSTLRSPNKRLLSLDATGVFDHPRRASPASFTEQDDARASGSPPSKHDEKYPRLSDLSPIPKNIPSGLSNHRAETLPEKFETEAPMMVTPQHVVNILDSQSEEVLLLDLRVSTQYARSRVSGALNLCIPTTLLKRPTYNVSRLADTFSDDAHRSKFEKWRSCKCVIVYDASSSHVKEAANCFNILKKFTSEGWQGNSYVIKGGFFEFARKFPQHLDQGSPPSKSLPMPDLTLKTDAEAIPPVIGGCPMPASVTKTAANPFFGNIRQNMDLIGGVGQMQITVPASATKLQLSNLPLWLRTAADENDHGRSISEKFLHIEKREQKRMQDALSGNVSYGMSCPESPSKIQIAGIEKGSKNRYNNIWPFEHSRVKLEGVPPQGCDYVNANYVQTSLSNKTFIATQGPIPATFTDFWNMVWQRDIRVIVMLTAETEGGQVKAHKYWGDRSYGPLKLNFLSEHRASLDLSKIRSHRERPSMSKHRSSYPSSSSSSNATRHSPTASRNDASDQLPKEQTSADRPFVHVRKFTLSHEGQPFERMREITHLQYASWPDFGAPAHPAHLLALVEQCDAVVRANTSITRMDAASQDQRPVLVHCSAGCGRTGTFCTVDSVIDILKKQNNYKRNKQRALLLQQQRKNTVQPSTMEVDSPSSSAPPQKEESSLSWIERDDIDLIEKAVEELRLQRLSMVQSLRQFVLCYETVLEWYMEQEPPASA